MSGYFAGTWGDGSREFALDPGKLLSYITNKTHFIYHPTLQDDIQCQAGVLPDHM